MSLGKLCRAVAANAWIGGLRSYAFAVNSRFLAANRSIGTAIACDRFVRIHRVQRRDHSSSGFSLIELMVVVVIIGIMAVSVAPSLAAVRADQRQSEAATELVGLLRRAWGATTRLGVAHAVVLAPDPAGSGFMTASVWTGMHRRCRQTPWLPAGANVARHGIADYRTAHAGGGAVGPVEAINFASYNQLAGGVATGHRVDLTIRMTPPGEAPAAETVLAICHQPNGVSYTTTNFTTAPATWQRQGRPVFLSIVRTLGSGSGVQQSGVPRFVVVNPTGAPRRFRP
ncbi:MAG: type II secretion system GspH family protein [Myxococcales bacterium]|nr:type II secretion system GspH family protein [Myxococcales bacterium]